MICNSYGSDEAIIRSFIASYTRVHLASDSYNVVLEDMGLDSLQATELSTALKRKFNTTISPDLLLISTIPHVLQLLARPLDALAQADASFKTFAKTRGYTNYWINVAPLFDELLLSYILEAFAALNVNLASIHEGSVIVDIAHLPKYDRLFERLRTFLTSWNLVLQLDGECIRSKASIKVRPSTQLNTALEELFPHYSPETKLLNLVGPRLAECVSGKTNPVTVMFGSLPALQIMEDFYANSPMMSTLTDQLVEFLSIFIRSKNGSHVQKPLKILEIGAGTGGTTTRLVEMLQTIECPIQYTFTDISTAFVSQAKRKYKQYPWMNFSVLNLEQDLEVKWQGQYDVVIGANVVHATSDRAATCRRLRTTLREGGFLVLSEITRVINWYDICFGLLDGWWLAEGGKGYPIQSAEAWMSTFRVAGFTRVGCSQGGGLEASSQQLLVACT
jgi:SAM-dependent methyltransferase/acyl carrier protein